MPSRCFQDESRCFGSKHVVFFWLCLRHARLRSSRDPWEGGGLTVPKENHTWKEFCKLILLACFGCIFFVAVFFQTRWKKDRNISEPLRSALHIVQDHKVLRDLTSIRVSSDRSAAICWLQVLSETGGVMQYGANTFLSVRDSFESHWITMTIFQIITLYYRMTVVENSINGFKPLQVMKLGAATALSSIPTNTTWEQLKKGHGVNTCQHTFYVAAHNVAQAA